MTEGPPQVKGFDTVLVLDYGAQYGQLIARRVRECRVYSELIPHDASLDRIRSYAPKGIILSGGPMGVYVDDAPRVDPGLFELGIPVLGICYGAQSLALELGGTVARTGTSEFGKTTLTVHRKGLILESMRSEEQCWMSHRDSITAAPPGFEVLASTPGAPVAAMEDRERGFYALQFHPEVVHTPRGMDVLRSFLYKACGCEPTFTPDAVVEEAVRGIRAQVGDAKAILGLSGGVDSSVAALLMHRAIGDRLTCVFVDQGMMRMREAERVIETFSGTFGIPLVAVDASDRFLARLHGVTDPEQKRKIIGEEFIRVFEDEAARLGRIDYLVQGTIYPDILESSSDNGVVKSHHNVGGLPDDFHFELVEPVKYLFKDEVRVAGELLGLPHRMVWRQPFPGPGLGVRVVGELTRDTVRMVRESDAIFRDEIAQAGLAQQIWQYFTVCPGGRAVGVVDGARTYGHAIVLRAVNSVDAMTADVAELPYDLLKRITLRIINEVAGVTRVMYDTTPKPPGTIEWE